MYSPALDIQGYPSIFGGFTTFYPGESLDFTFENGTALNQVPWLVRYYDQGDTGPLTTGGDFYNFFVLGLYPASYVAPSPNTTSTGPTSTETTSTGLTATVTEWPDLAYPRQPDVVQPNLSASNGGVLTGYLFNDTLTGVLSIPSFEVFGDPIKTFGDTVGEFIQRSKAAGMKKIVIDVQQNAGGNVLLAISTFKQVSLRFFFATRSFQTDTF